MRKDEIRATHGLLHVVAQHIKTSHPDAEFSNYRDVPVGPRAVHKQKGDHEEATFALLDDITAAIEQKDTDSEATEEHPPDAPIPI